MSGIALQPPMITKIIDAIDICDVASVYSEFN